MRYEHKVMNKSSQSWRADVHLPYLPAVKKDSSIYPISSILLTKHEIEC